MYEATFPKKALHSIDLIKHFEFSFFFQQNHYFSLKRKNETERNMLREDAKDARCDDD